MNEIIINGEKYIKESEIKTAEKLDGMKFCVVRTYSAGVHIGYVKEFGIKNPQHATLINSRRLHYWADACSLSQVAMDGVGKGSRIAMAVPEIELTDVIEIITCSEKAKSFFEQAAVWKK